MNKFDGVITSAELNQPIQRAEFEICDSFGFIKKVIKSDRSGNWLLHNVDDADSIHIHKDGYNAKNYQVKDLPEHIRLLKSKLIGYQSQLSYAKGADISVFVNAPNDFSASLYRHGMKKKLVLPLGEYNRTSQRVPDRYFVESGVGWNRTFSYSLPMDIKSGLYSLLLKDTEETFAIPFVVSATKNNSKDASLLVLISTNTWQAYNVWGGRNRYRNYEDGITKDLIKHPVDSIIPIGLRQMVSAVIPGPLKSTLKKRLGMSTSIEETWRYKKLNVHRPFTNCALEERHVFKPFINHLAAGDWRILAWLERQGIEFEVATDVMLDNQPELINSYQGVILSTHCEYWTRRMFDALESAHKNNGLWIINLSGNSIYREMKLLEDNSFQWVGIFGDTYKDESDLLGVRHTTESYGTAAPYRVELPNHWVYEGVEVNKNMKFGGLSLNQTLYSELNKYDPGKPGLKGGLKGMGASGWETDVLSKTASGEFRVVARGLNPRGGADMVIREESGTRGSVFSASSILFGGSLLIDNVSSTIVENVIKRAITA